MSNHYTRWAHEFSGPKRKASIISMLFWIWGTKLLCLICYWPVYFLPTCDNPNLCIIYNSCKTVSLPQTFFYIHCFALWYYLLGGQNVMLRANIPKPDFCVNVREQFQKIPWNEVKIEFTHLVMSFSNSMKDVRTNRTVTIS